MKKLFILLAGLAFSVSFAQLMPSEVATINQVSEYSTTNLLESCSELDMYSGEEMIYVGDFTGRSIANAFNVAPSTSFSLETLEMFVTVPTDATVSNVIVSILADADNAPGEILVEEVSLTPSLTELFQQISFTGGETADELIVSYDLSSLGSFEGGATGAKFWIVTQTTASVAPVRHATQVPSDEDPTFLLRTAGWGPLATSTAPDTPIEIPYTLIGDCSVMGVLDVNAAELAVYPNPAKDVLNVSLKNAEVKSISVTNLSGQTVATSKNSTVNVAALPAGVYVVKVIDTKGAVHTSKVVVK